MKKQQASIIREPERPLQVLHDGSESMNSSKAPPDKRSADRPLLYSRGVSIKEAALSASYWCSCRLRQFTWQSSQPLFSNHSTEHILYLEMCRQSISIRPSSRNDKLAAFTILRVFTSHPDR